MESLYLKGAVLFSVDKSRTQQRPGASDGGPGPGPGVPLAYCGVCAAGAGCWQVDEGLGLTERSVGGI